MTSTLDAAIAKLAALSPDEQDRVGRWLLYELADDEQWTRKFETSQDLLTKLAAEARADRIDGRATDVDPDRLGTRARLRASGQRTTTFLNPSETLRARRTGCFKSTRTHPRLQFKKIHDREPIYWVRVTLGYRPVGLLEGNEVTWFWIGSHADYDRLVKSL
jgi:hypothetical protein